MSEAERISYAEMLRRIEQRAGDEHFRWCDALEPKFQGPTLQPNGHYDGAGWAQLPCNCGLNADIAALRRLAGEIDECERIKRRIIEPEAAVAICRRLAAGFAPEQENSPNA